ncbi:hypothetical protein ACLOJK_018062 [Asimina triloba]
MEDPAAASEASFRRPKRGRVADPPDGDPSKSNPSNGEQADQPVEGSDQGQQEMDQVSGDGSFDDLDQVVQPAKKKKTENATALLKAADQSAAAVSQQSLIEEFVRIAERTMPCQVAISSELSVNAFEETVATQITAI